MMTIDSLLAAVKAGEPVSFQQTQAVIAAHYAYQATAFRNGVGDDELLNPPGTNEGSCKLFAFARLHGLDEAQTLALFGDFYRDVLADPDGDGHRNIRNFIKYGWAGISFDGQALTPLTAGA